MTGPMLVLDPVCGMMIDPATAAGSRVHRDVTYYLCSTGCVLKFDADADAYVAASRAEGFFTWQSSDHMDGGQASA